MKDKEEQEDQDLLEEFKVDEAPARRKQSAADSVEADIEGTDAENIKKKIEQVEGYDEDEKVDDDASDDSENNERSGHKFADENMIIDDVDDNLSLSKISKLDINSKLSNFKPFLQQFNFVTQQNKPEFSRAKIVISIHINLDSNKGKLSKILMLSLVEAILQKVLIRSVKGINKSYVIERKTKEGTKEKVVQTEGINFDE
jgi:hypothetical protein